MRTIRVALAGLGNVGRSFLAILESQRDELRSRFGVEVAVVGIADSRGAAIDPAGLDPAGTLAAKRDGSIGTIPGAGRPGWTATRMLESVTADVLLEATPVDLRSGQPGLDLVRMALGRGMDCVLANKAPLALAYQELAGLGSIRGAGRPKLRFSACVGGALPTVNLGIRDLAGARILGLECILNGTSQGILRAMESGGSFEAALAEMQRRGIAEADPALDVDGWDQAVKLVILANAVLHRPTTLADVRVTGIREVTATALREAAARGERLVLLGRAAPRQGDWQLSVAPTALPLDHPLARMSGDEMGIVYRTDIAGTHHATSAETDAVPTAAAMLRDLLDLGG